MHAYIYTQMHACIHTYIHTHRLGKEDATLEQVKAACQKSNAAQFISTLPQVCRHACVPVSASVSAYVHVQTYIHHINMCEVDVCAKSICTCTDAKSICTCTDINAPRKRVRSQLYATLRHVCLYTYILTSHYCCVCVCIKYAT